MVLRSGGVGGERVRASVPSVRSTCGKAVQGCVVSYEMVTTGTVVGLVASQVA